MNKEELLIYEAPTFTEFVSNDFLQNLIARFLAWKVSRKIERYNFRKQREAYFSAPKK